MCWSPAIHVFPKLHYMTVRTEICTGQIARRQSLFKQNTLSLGQENNYYAISIS